MDSLSASSTRGGVFSDVYLREIIASSADLIWAKDIEGRYLYCNAAFERFLGRPASHILGKTDKALTSSDQSLGFQLTDEQVIESGTTSKDEKWLTFADGYRGRFETAKSPVLDKAGEIVATIGVARDISARHQAESALRELNRTLYLMTACHQVLVRATNEELLVQEICDLMVRHGGYALAWIGLVTNDADCRVVILAASGATDYLNGLSISYGDDFSGQGPTGSAIKENRPVWTRDIQTDETFARWRDRASQFRFRSSIAIPLSSSNGVLGALTIYSTVPDRFSSEEVSLLTELSNDLAYGLVALSTERERAAADAQLSQTDQRLREISENIRDVFYSISPDSSQFLYVSPAYERVWGQSVEDLYADPFAWLRIIHPDDRSAARQLFLSGLTQGSFGIEYRLLHPDGSTRWISSHGNPVFDDKGRLMRIIGVAMDVTDAKLFQLENQRLTARLATTLETVSDSMFTLDEQWRFTYLNRAAEDQFRHSRESLLGKVFWEALPDAIGTISEESYREAKGSQQNVEFERYSPQLDKWVHCRVYPHNEGVAVYFQDITEAKRAEQELRQHALRLQALSRRLFQVEEEERRRLGRELHDQTGSNLTAMTLSLEMLRRRLPVASDDPTDLSSWFTDFEALLQDTIRHVRTVLSDLRPVALDELGLLAALRHYFSRTQSFADMTLLIDEVDPLPRLSPDVEIALFRVAQEALTNIVKHAHASTVTIGVNRDPEWLTIRIQDNGKGFYGRLGSSVTSLGMTTMKERVEGIGARWSVRSAPNQGTVVTIDLPLSEQVLAPSTARRQ